MKRSPAQYIAISQIILGFCLLTSLLLVPRYFFSLDQGGISNYGTEQRTWGLFVFGFGAASLGAFLAAQQLSRRTTRQRRFRAALRALGGLYLVLLVSTFPYKLSSDYRELHQQAAIALFVGMVALLVWLGLIGTRDSRINAAIIVFGAGFVLALLTQAQIVHLLFTSQLLCGASFGYILSRGTAAVEGHGALETTSLM